MSLINRVDVVIDSTLKVAILRVFTAHKGLRVTGRDMAVRVGYSAPSTHEALKGLLNEHVLDVEIIGKQHIYSLNEKNRLVQKCIRPMFDVERDFQKDVKSFVIKLLDSGACLEKITSVILYGSVSRGEASKQSDVDMAFVVSQKKEVGSVEDFLLNHVVDPFFVYFGVHLDIYVKSVKEFSMLRDNKEPPLNQMIKTHSILYGKDMKDI